MGIVYLVHASGTNLYKIGMTINNVQKRVSELQTGSPHELKCIAALQSDEAHVMESRLHHRFKNYRVRGEWFEFDEHTPGIEETFGVKICAVKESGFRDTYHTQYVDRVVYADWLTIYRFALLSLVLVTAVYFSFEYYHSLVTLVGMLHITLFHLIALYKGV